MQTIKGLIALLLVAVGVFTAVLIFNNQTGPGHDTTVKKSIVADTASPTKQPGMGKTSDAEPHPKSQKGSL